MTFRAKVSAVKSVLVAGLYLSLTRASVNARGGVDEKGRCIRDFYARTQLPHVQKVYAHAQAKLRAEAPLLANIFMRKQPQLESQIRA